MIPTPSQDDIEVQPAPTAMVDRAGDKGKGAAEDNVID